MRRKILLKNLINKSKPKVGKPIIKPQVVHSSSSFLPVVIFIVALILYVFWEHYRKYYWHEIISKRNRNNEVAYFSNSQLTSSSSVKVIDDYTLSVNKVIFGNDKLKIDESEIPQTLKPNSVCCIGADGKTLSFNELITCNKGTIICENIETNQFRVKNLQQKIDLNSSKTAFLTFNTETKNVSCVVLNQSRYTDDEDCIIAIRNKELLLIPPLGNVLVSNPEERILDYPHLVQFHKTQKNLVVQYLDLLDTIPPYTLGIDDSKTVVCFESINQDSLSKLMPPVTDDSEINFLSCDKNQKISWYPLSHLMSEINDLTSELMTDESNETKIILFDCKNKRLKLLENPSNKLHKYFLSVTENKFKWQSVIHYDEFGNYSDGNFAIIDSKSKNIKKASRKLFLSSGNPGDVLTLLPDGNLGLKPVPKLSSIDKHHLVLPQTVKKDDIVLVTVDKNYFAPLIINESDKLNRLLVYTDSNEIKYVSDTMSDFWLDILTTKQLKNSMLYYQKNEKKIKMMAISDNFFNSPRDRNYSIGYRNNEIILVDLTQKVTEVLNKQLELKPTSKTNLRIVLYDATEKKFVKHPIYTIPSIPDSSKTDFALCLMQNKLQWVESKLIFQQTLVDIPKVTSFPSHFVCTENDKLHKVPIIKTKSISKNSFVITYNENAKELQCIDLPFLEEKKSVTLIIDESMQYEWIDVDQLFLSKFIDYFKIFNDFLNHVSDHVKESLLIFDHVTNKIKSLEIPENYTFGLIGWNEKSLKYFPVDNELGTARQCEIVGLTKEHNFCLSPDLYENNNMLSNLNNHKGSLTNSIVTFNHRTRKLEAQTDYQLPKIPSTTSTLVYNKKTNSLLWRPILPDTLPELNSSDFKTELIDDDSVLTYSHTKQSIEWVPKKNLIKQSHLHRKTLNEQVTFHGTINTKTIFQQKFENNGKENLMILFNGYCNNVKGFNFLTIKYEVQGESTLERYSLFTCSGIHFFSFVNNFSVDTNSKYTHIRLILENNKSTEDKILIFNPINFFSPFKHEEKNVAAKLSILFF